MNFKALVRAVMVVVAVSFATLSHAQSIVSEDFTGQTTNSQWFFFNGACLTAGRAQDTLTPPANPGIIPGCAKVISTYYHGAKDQDAAIVGGENGYLGLSTAPSSYTAVVPDDNGSGALRFTNGAPYGHNESGAIVSNYTFPTTQGVQITFKTVTYLGDSGGSGNDGADGMSFFLLDGCMPVVGATVPTNCTQNPNPIYGTTQTFPAIGAFGGSLAYSCSNSNSPYDGLVGGYLGLGIDEFGNFLNGTTNTLGESGTSATGDNTATGGGYQPGRIGLRGAGSISWQALTTAYGTLTSTGPYYPASMATTCTNGVPWDSTTNSCGQICPSGSSFNAAANQCDTCPSGTAFSAAAGYMCGSCTNSATYDPSTNTCSPAGYCTVGTYNAANNQCSNVCPSGSTYNGTANNCGSCPSGYTPDWRYWTTNGTVYCDNDCSTGTYEGSHTTYPNMCVACTAGSPSWSNSGNKWKCSNSGASSVNPLVVAATTPPSSPTATPTLAAPQAISGTVSGTTGSPISISAVQKTCSTGHLWNYSNTSAPTDQGPATLTSDPTNPNPLNTAGVLDYGAIPNAYSVIPTPTQDAVNGFKIAAEGSSTRASAAPILYNLKITQDGLLSLSYSYNGGSTVPVITNKQITTSNGPLPSSFRFGFAGSTGGDTNIHEILCFKAAPVEASSSSGAVNVYQNPLIRTGTQIYIANYFPSDWTGQLEAIPLGVTNGTPGIGTPLWDARCVLSGPDASTGKCDATGQSSPSAQSPSSRVMLTWDPVLQVGEEFEWGTGGITSVQQGILTKGDTSSTGTRLAYLRGDRTNEIGGTGLKIYRARDAVLSDIVDSSPSWIGPPENPYTLVNSWVDQTQPLVTQPENATGAQTYLQFMTPASSTSTPANPYGEQQRENIVYAGANDGFLHGFRAGALDINGNLVTSTYLNDGQEVLAYMPSVVLNKIHPVDSSGNVIAQLDFSNAQYSHNWYVDATPAQGDLFYNNKWHTWVVSGLGPGGAAIFALDVTDPTQFSEGNAKNIVIGEWSTTSTTTTTNGTTTTTWSSNLTCQVPTGAANTIAACGAKYLGNTYGTPVIRRFHNGQWGAIFGNGYGSQAGTAGIFIMLVNSSGTPSFWYLPTGLATTGNGIGPTTSADLDLDHTVDFIYAGDLLGNVWRFDVTSPYPVNWAVSTSSPMFNAGQPITTQPQVSTVKTITTVVNAVGLDVSNAPERVIINFGTGRQTPQTLNSGATYASGTQYLYGIWDWDMGTPSSSTTTGTGWNGISPHQQGIGLTGTQSITLANMQSQTLTETPSVATSGGGTTTGTATLTKNVVCWKGGSTCGDGSSTSNAQMGWYTALPGTNEQIIFDPFVDKTGGALIWNTYIPSPSGVLSCTQNGATGFSLGMDAATGAGLATALFNVGGTSYDGVQNNASGTGSVINAGAAGGGKNYLVTHSGNGTVNFTQLNNYTVTTGQRIYWIQKR